ncbi:hypothetical protein CEE36_07735 [candidate division TA06 bacterium B3_TA06]|uniref:Photosynthesis system II assembly factor Ycf48/Hcf136-like domain-containing protein n=1 Tax=candidate division TA06 bacterium B3_TA06 TaxID=2012487 RepID=A0A532V4K7_UNCT6|nr:MAG: hypothetical protein CEE36_07735 [candidate division TA06 bacterium B3_TA06]
MAGLLLGFKVLLSITQVWSSNGPYGGLGEAVCVDGGANPYIYTNEGFYRKLGGFDWQRIDGYEPIPFTVDWMNEVAFIESKLWSCPRKGGLWWHAEDAPGWSQAQGIPTDADVVGICGIGDTIVVATQSNGLWLSEDNGASFQIFPDWHVPGAKISALAVHEKVLAVAVSNYRQIRIRRPLDTWRTEELPGYVPSGILSLEWTSGSIGALYLHVGTASGVTYVLNPHIGPGDWKGDMELVGVQIQDLAAAGGDLYAATFGGIALSHDHGSSWSEASNGLVSLFVTDLAGWEGGVMAATFDGLYRRVGSGWAVIEELPAQTFTGIVVNLDAPTRLMVSSFGSGGFISDNAGESWDRTGANDITLAFDLASGETNEGSIFYAGLFNGIGVSKDEGRSWLVYTISDETGAPCIVPFVVSNPGNGNEVWFVAIGRWGGQTQYRICYSSDGLDNYIVTENLEWRAVADLTYSPLDRKLYVATVLGSFRTDEPEVKGSLKQTADAGLPANGLPIQFEVAGTRLYTLLDNNQVCVSTDGAESWSKVTGLESVNVQRIATDPSLPEFLLAADVYKQIKKGFSVYFTTDGGENWDVRPDPAPGMAQVCEVRVAESKAHVYVASAEGVFYDVFEVDLPPPEVQLSLWLPDTVQQGDAFNISVRANRLVDSITVHIKHLTDMQVSWPDSIYPPQDSVNYDSLTAWFFNTGELEIGLYQATAQAYLGMDITAAVDTLTVVADTLPDTLILTLSAPDQIFAGDTLEVAVTANILTDSIQLHLQHIELGDEFYPDYRFPADSTGYDSLYARFSNTAGFPEGSYRVIANAYVELDTTSVVDTLTVVADTLPDILILTLSAPDQIFAGDTFQVVVKSNILADSIQLHLQHAELGDEFYPDYCFPTDSADYDSLYACFSKTGEFPEGSYRVIADAQSGVLESKVEDTLEVLARPDTTILVDPKQVFFVPSPAVNQSTGRVYYDLGYDARVTLEIFTARARRLLYHEEAGGDLVSAGYHNYVEIDISDLGADVYFFRLTVDARDNPTFQAIRDAAPDGEKPDDVVVVTKPFVVVR